mmetsp:Transcript_17577/g.35282  ORF Transcript_17577/g.35282 Transcript_17577/m.35282 type:complete len:340 (+) Transcript_17577:373-1392(+)
MSSMSHLATSSVWCCADTWGYSTLRLKVSAASALCPSLNPSRFGSTGGGGLPSCGRYKTRSRSRACGGAVGALTRLSPFNAAATESSVHLLRACRNSTARPTSVCTCAGPNLLPSTRSTAYSVPLNDTFSTHSNVVTTTGPCSFLMLPFATCLQSEAAIPPPAAKSRSTAPTAFSCFLPSLNPFMWPRTAGSPSRRTSSGMGASAAEGTKYSKRRKVASRSGSKRTCDGWLVVVGGWGLCGLQKAQLRMRTSEGSCTLRPSAKAARLMRGRTMSTVTHWAAACTPCSVRQAGDRQSLSAVDRLGSGLTAPEMRSTFSSSISTERLPVPSWLKPAKLVPT